MTDLSEEGRAVLTQTGNECVLTYPEDVARHELAKQLEAGGYLVRVDQHYSPWTEWIDVAHQELGYRWRGTVADVWLLTRKALKLVGREMYADARWKRAAEYPDEPEAEFAAAWAPE